MHSLSRATIQPKLKQYCLRILTENHMAPALDLFKHDFAKYEPLRTAYFKKYPETIQNEYYQYWDNLGISYREKVFKSGLSIGCFDMENNEELVGVVLVKDAKVEDEANKATSIEKAGLRLVDKMKTTMDPIHLQLIQSDEVRTIEHCLGAVKNDHNGRGLLTSMLAAGDFIGGKHKYQYSLGWASNFKSKLALRRLNYYKIGEVDAKEFQFQGEKYFELIEEESRNQTLWIKDIQNIQENSLPIKLIH